MPKLIVQLKQRTVQELDLTGDRVVIGRGDESAIKLDDNLVSREHAEIREENGRYFLSDLGSANGTYVGKRKIARDYELRDRDVIRISPYTITFQLGVQERPTQVGMVETVEKPTEVFTFSGTPRLLVRTGAEVGQSFDLSRNPLIGRSPECDICLNEATVSRKHARVQFIDNKLLVVDVGSRSGTRVNGKLIDKPTPLKDGDRVQLGEAMLDVDWKGGAARPVESGERPTVPFFPPEPAPAAKGGDWWKWVVGIAAALIVVVGAVLLVPGIFGGSGRLVNEARAMYYAAAKTSDVLKLDEALAKAGSAGAKGAALRDSIAATIDAVKNAINLADQARQDSAKGRLDDAVANADLAFTADPNSKDIRNTKAAMHKARAFFLESRKKATQALFDWKVVNELHPDDAIAAQRVGTPVHVPDSDVIVRPKPLSKKAMEAYHQGRIEEAKGIVDQILKATPNDADAEKLQGWIEKWEYGLYLIQRGEKGEARKIFKELLSLDPGNQKLAEIIVSIGYDIETARKLFKEAEAQWNLWIDWGQKEAYDKAMDGYKKIVDMAPPPQDAAQDDKDIFATAKKRLGTK